MFGWGLLARRVDAVPRGLPPGRSHRLLGPVESGAARLRRRGGSRGWYPSPTRGTGPRRPIRRGWPGSARTASAPALRHATQLLLHAVHGPLLPGAPICSSSSRPLLVALVVLDVVPLLLFLPTRDRPGHLLPTFARGQSTRGKRNRGTRSRQRFTLRLFCLPLRPLLRPINGQRVKVRSASTKLRTLEDRCVSDTSASIFNGLRGDAV